MDVEFILGSLEVYLNNKFPAQIYFKKGIYGIIFHLFTSAIEISFPEVHAHRVHYVQVDVI